VGERRDADRSGPRPAGTPGVDADTDAETDAGTGTGADGAESVTRSGRVARAAPDVDGSAVVRPDGGIGRSSRSAGATPTGDRALTRRVAVTLAAIVAVNLAFVLALAAFLRPWLVPVGTAIAEALSVTVPPMAGWAVLVLTTLVAVLLAQARYARRAALREAGVETSADDAASDLRARVARLATAFDVTPPQVLVVDSPVANAFTVDGLGDATLVVSRALPAALCDAELDAVLAHELAHVKNHDAAVLTLAAFLPALVGDGYSVRRDLLPFDRAGGTAVLVIAAGLLVAGASLVPGLTVGGAVVAVAVALVVGAIAVGALAAPVVLLGRRLARTRELIADRAGAIATGDPAAMASALRRLDDRARHPPETDARARPRAETAAAGRGRREPGNTVDGAGGRGDETPTRSGTTVRALCFLPNGFDPIGAAAGSEPAQSPFDVRAHPPIEERLARLRELTADVAGGRRPDAGV
jgi:heat shock protein HtpX